MTSEEMSGSDNDASNHPSTSWQKSGGWQYGGDDNDEDTSGNHPFIILDNTHVAENNNNKNCLSSMRFVMLFKSYMLSRVSLAVYMVDSG